MIVSHKRGHEIFYDFDRQNWVYSDTREPAKKERPCIRCGQMPTKEGHDACLGTLPEVRSACCGHGLEKKWTRKEKEKPLD